MRLPNSDPTSRVPPGRPSSSSVSHHLPESFFPPADLPLRKRSRSPDARCTAPPTKLSFSDAIEYELNKLEFIRIVSKANPHRIFGLRKYTFPVDKSIRLAVGRNRFMPIPNQEHIVLSTLDGDAFAILESGDCLAGLYGGYGSRRLKINMESGEVTPLNRNEIYETPVGDQRPILKYFKVEHVGQNRRHSTPNEK